jgi:hypothetical protein
MATFYTRSPITFGEDDLVTTVYTVQKFPLGLYREEDGKGYRFVSYDNGTGNLAAVAGNLAYTMNDVVTVASATAGYWEVTMDVSDTDRNKVRGVFAAVIADGGFGWIQTKGPCTVNTNGDDDIAEGDAVIASAAGDGTADSTAQDTAPTNRVVGWALADDVNGSNTVIVDLDLD